MIKGIFYLILSLSFTQAHATAPIEEFWQWFVANQDILYDSKYDVESTFKQLDAKIKQVHSSLTFEMGPISKNGSREFIISANGIKTAFPAVESLYAAAPRLPKWQFIKFRPRRKFTNTIQYKGKVIAAKDVEYKLFQDGNKVGIMIFLEGYKKEEFDIYGNIGYLLLDNAIGEYDVEMKVGFIGFHPKTSKQINGSRPITELAGHFDDYFKRLH